MEKEIIFEKLEIKKYENLELKIKCRNCDYIDWVDLDYKKEFNFDNLENIYCNCVDINNLDRFILILKCGVCSFSGRYNTIILHHYYNLENFYISESFNCDCENQ